MDISLQLSLKFINGLIKIVSPELVQHMERTTIVAMELCQFLGVSREQQRNLFIASLLHDVGEMVDIRGRDLGDFHSNNEQHQRYTYAMLDGLKVFAPIRQIVYTRNEETKNEYALEKMILSFCDLFERDLCLFPKNLAPVSEDICAAFKVRHTQFPAVFYEFLDILSQREYFWFRLQTDNIPRVINLISPIKIIHLDIDGFQDICTLIARIVDTHSEFTAAHSVTVGLVAKQLACYAGMAPFDQQRIGIAGYLHDIGKLYVPVSILEKKGRLSKKEYSMIKEHSYKTGEMLSMLPSLGDIADWAANHHERLDGSGYPFHLNRSYLDVPCRMIAVADFFTALIELRPYRAPLSLDEALAILDAEAAGGFIDGEIVGLLHQHKEAFYAIATGAREKGCAFSNAVAA